MVKLHNNTAIGVGTLTQSTGTDNTALGYNAGLVITTGTQNTFFVVLCTAQNGTNLSTMQLLLIRCIS
jgi:hypothetical protein